ncbi:HEAT repeat domain-containing protein [Candidatus Lokiarchaeum ossiferum]|uniref:HEAT repeat domain-containing protein n=1 Tax=Candidatus Lokiarchaeum ossiferum TaxID=2951803 RepID=UPI00352E4854
MGSYNKSLKQLIDDDPEIRIKALRVLGDQKASECLSDIIRIIEKDTDDNVKLEAVVTLGKIGDISAGDILLPFLESDDVPLIMECVNVLGLFCANGYTKGIPPIEKLIDHPNFRVRKFAIDALGKAGSSSSLQLLFDHLKKEETSIETKQLVATAIGQIGGSEAINILKLLISPNDEVAESVMEVRRAAIYALGESKKTAALDILGKIYNNKEEHKIIRKYAEEAIKKTILGAKQDFLAIKQRAEDVLKGKK